MLDHATVLFVIVVSDGIWDLVCFVAAVSVLLAIVLFVKNMDDKL
jgi:hypothetical protein